MVEDPGGNSLAGILDLGGLGRKEEVTFLNNPPQYFERPFSTPPQSHPYLSPSPTPFRLFKNA
jgi:hypothetical protein